MRRRHLGTSPAARAAQYVASMLGGGKERGSFRTNEGSQRLLAFAEENEVHDERLWTALAKATGAAGDLFVTTRIMLPDGNDAELEALMEKWRDDHPYNPRSDLG